MTKSNSRKYSLKTVKVLYAKSGNQCYMPGCNKELISSTSGEEYNISEIAHISSLNSKDLRYNPELTEDDLNSPENLILLCPNHHKEIDAIENKDTYTIEYLQKIKNEHEGKISNKKGITILNNTDCYKIRIETEQKEDISKIIDRLSKTVTILSPPSTYEHRDKKGYYHYFEIKL